MKITKTRLKQIIKEELTGAIQNLLRDKKITDKGTKGAKYYPTKED